MGKQTPHQRIREAATTDHANCCFLSPLSFSQVPCPVCERPHAVPFTVVPFFWGVFAGLLIYAVVELLIGDAHFALKVTFP